jgi:hypothetical protein
LFDFIFPFKIFLGSYSAQWLSRVKGYGHMYDFCLADVQKEFTANRFSSLWRPGGVPPSARSAVGIKPEASSCCSLGLCWVMVLPEKNNKNLHYGGGGGGPSNVCTCK